MTPLDSVILGVVEGITEFLPISSTGHLILTAELLGLAPTEFLKSYEIVIQLGAIAAVVFLYWRSFLDLEVLKRITAAFIPTAVIGFLLYSFIKDYLFESMEVILASLFLGGVALIALELFHKEKDDAHKDVKDITYRQAFFIGLIQTLAVIPGVSRSGATIVGGLLLGVSRVAIVEFSFLLAVPTIAAATGYDLLRNSHVFTENDFLLLAIGFVVSFLVAIVAIKFLLNFIRNYTFIPFGIYRILLALVFFFVIL
ncbi:undecaprenyl-diphosphate phosphatase [Patescibacteria group bacterium]|nr:undecaprenyl-diphosphate phosphatase [Patescibacteria group bacterium]